MSTVAGSEYGGDRQGKVDTEIREKVLSVVFHPTQPLLAFGTATSKVKIFSLVTNKVIYILPRVGEVKCVKFSSDGRFLATAHAAAPHQVKQIRDPRTNQKESPYKINVWNVEDNFRFVKDSDTMAETQDKGAFTPLHTAAINSISFCPHEITFEHAEIQEKSMKHTRSMTQAVASAPSIVRKSKKTLKLSLLASGAEDGSVALWDYEKNRKWPVRRQQYEDYEGKGSCNAVDFASNGEMLAAAFSRVGVLGDKHIVCIWKVNHRRKQKRDAMGGVRGLERTRKTQFLLQHAVTFDSTEIRPISGMAFFPLRSWFEVEKEKRLLKEKQQRDSEEKARLYDNNDDDDSDQSRALSVAPSAHPVDPSMAPSRSRRGSVSGASEDGFGGGGGRHSRRSSFGGQSEASDAGTEIGDAIGGPTMEIGGLMDDNDKDPVYRIAIGATGCLIMIHLKKIIREAEDDPTESKKDKKKNGKSDRVYEDIYESSEVGRAEHPGHLNCVTVDASGYYICTAEAVPSSQGTHEEYTITLWTAVGDAVTAVHVGKHERDITSVAFSSPGVAETMASIGASSDKSIRYIASASLDESVRFFTWNDQTGKPISRVQLVERPVTERQRRDIQEMKQQLLEAPKTVANTIALDLKEEELLGLMSVKENATLEKRAEESLKLQSANQKASQKAKNAENVKGKKPTHQYSVGRPGPKKEIDNIPGMGVPPVAPVRSRPPNKSMKMLNTFVKFARNTSKFEKRVEAEEPDEPDKTSRGSCRTCTF